MEDISFAGKLLADGTTASLLIKTDVDGNPLPTLTPALTPGP